MHISNLITQPSLCFTCIGGEKKGIAMPATREQWEEVRRSERVAELSRLILDASDEKTQKMYKDQLPFWTPHCAQFLNNHRQQPNALKPLRRLMIDIDDEKGKTADIIAMATKSESESLFIGPFEVLLIEESIRKGTHMLVRLPEGMTPSEAQQQIADILGMKVDSAVKNVASMIFQVPAENTKYVSDKLFCIEEDLAPSQVASSPVAPLVSSENQVVASSENQVVASSAKPASAPSANSALVSEASASDVTYQSFPMSDIIRKYAEIFWKGKYPEEGERNSRIFEFAVHVRTVCNYSQQRLEAIIPLWGGIGEQEWRQTIANALKEPRKGVSYRINQVVEALRQEQRLKVMGGTAISAPEPPKRLPKMLKLLTSCTPTIAKVATMENVWAALATHIHGVKIRHIDGKLREINFQQLLIGQQSVGKGYIVEPIEAILADIKARDAINRERENEYKRRNPTGAKKEKEPRPKDIIVQVLADDNTDAAFTQRVIDAEINGQRYVYTRVDEVELLKRVTSSKRIEDTHLLMRKAHDNAEHGQERVGSDSVCGNAHLRWNFNASSTPVNAMAFLKRGLNDGTLSRLCISTILPKEDDYDDDIPYQGDYDAKFYEELKPYLLRLDTANGLIECKKAEKLIHDINRECKKNAALFDSKSYFILSKRALVIGYMKAMLLYIANDYNWGKDIEDYIRWSVNYDLWCKMHYFGVELDKQLSVERKLAKSNPQDILSLLPETFTLQEYLNLRMQLGKEGDGKATLRTWKHREYIAEDQVSGRFVKLKKAA